MKYCIRIAQIRVSWNSNNNNENKNDNNKKKYIDNNRGKRPINTVEQFCTL